MHWAMKSSQWLCALLVASTASHSIAQWYEIVPLYGPAGTFQATDLNNAGHASGNLAEGQAAFWSPQTGIVPLGYLGGIRSAALSINDAGFIVGSSQYLDFPNSSEHAILWRGGPPLIELNPQQIQTNIANDISNLAWIVGETTLAGQPPSNRRAFVMIDANGDGEYQAAETTILPSPQPLFEANRDQAIALNDSGLIVGRSGGFSAWWYFDAAMQHWRGITLRDFSGGYAVEVAEVSAGGQIVGGASLGPAQSASHAFVFADANGNRVQDDDEMVSLGSLSGQFGSSHAADINNNGLVVGWSSASVPGPLGRRPTLWVDGRVIDLYCVLGLESCDFFHDEATAINDAGQIVVRTGNASILLNPLPDWGGTVPDRDGDYICDCIDNCPDACNPFQEDSDGDGVGNQCSGCRGDLNMDRRVDLRDLTMMLSHFGATAAPFNFGDVDCDQAVGLTDLSILLAGFGGVCD